MVHLVYELNKEIDSLIKTALIILHALWCVKYSRCEILSGMLIWASFWYLGVFITKYCVAFPHLF